MILHYTSHTLMKMMLQLSKMLFHLDIVYNFLLLLLTTFLLHRLYILMILLVRPFQLNIVYNMLLHSLLE